MAPIQRKRFHYDWHWFWDYGNGDLGNQGIHQMDIARWFLGEPELAPRVWSVGGRLGYDDDGQTPNTQIVFHDYPKAPLIFEVRGLPSGRAEQGKAEKLSPDKLPPQIMAAINGRFPGAQVTSAEKENEDGKIVYDLNGMEALLWNEPLDPNAKYASRWTTFAPRPPDTHNAKPTETQPH